jgi:protein TonB
MTNSTELSDTLTAQDRFGLTLFFAVVAHAVLILGISIGHLPVEVFPSTPTMEITLVTQRSEVPPEDPDFLANADQAGGGNIETETPPLEPPPPAETTTPVAEPVPEPVPEPVAEPIPEPEPAPEPEKIVKQRKAESKKIIKKELLTQAESDHKIATAPESSEPLPTAEELINRGMEIASLSAQINESVQNYAQRPKQKYISARTQEYKYAAYMEAWRAKVENIGNLNYPDAAKRDNLSGSLILDVALNSDGSVREITLRQSSGEKVLDDAAIRIVELSSPFAPFPAEIREEVDILHITRTWQFKRDNRLSSK